MLGGGQEPAHVHSLGALHVQGSYMCRGARPALEPEKTEKRDATSLYQAMSDLPLPPKQPNKNDFFTT